METLPYDRMPKTETPEARRQRVIRHLRKAMALPEHAEGTFWRDAPLISPRAAHLLQDPDTKEMLLRATRGLGRRR